MANAKRVKFRSLQVAQADVTNTNELACEHRRIPLSRSIRPQLIEKRHQYTNMLERAELGGLRFLGKSRARKGPHLVDY